MFQFRFDRFVDAARRRRAVGVGFVDPQLRAGRGSRRGIVARIQRRIAEEEFPADGEGFRRVQKRFVQTASADGLDVEEAGERARQELVADVEAAASNELEAGAHQPGAFEWLERFFGGGAGAPVGRVGGRYRAQYTGAERQRGRFDFGFERPAFRFDFREGAEQRRCGPRAVVERSASFSPLTLVVPSTVKAAGEEDLPSSLSVYTGTAGEVIREVAVRARRPRRLGWPARAGRTRRSASRRAAGNGQHYEPPGSIGMVETPPGQAGTRRSGAIWRLRHLSRGLGAVYTREPLGTGRLWDERSRRTASWL